MRASAIKKFVLIPYIFFRALFNWILLLVINPSSIRLFIPWVISLKRDQSPLKDNRPWITFKSLEWLETFLSSNCKKTIIFEYGSGGSTIFLARRIKKLISVEHDKKWYRLVSKALMENNISNCEYLLIQPEVTNNKKVNILKHNIKYTSADPNYLGMTFETYVKSIESFPDNSFNLVFIDGRARPFCILHAIPKVRPGGFLMLDNSERGWYQEVINKYLFNWKRIDFFGPGPYNSYFWQTTVWKKPHNNK